MQLWAVLEKDLRLSLRTRAQAVAVLAFGAAALLVTIKRLPSTTGELVAAVQKPDARLAR